MDAFIVTCLIMLGVFGGFCWGNIHALDKVKRGELEQEGYSYSYFRNVRKRRMMGRA